MKSKFKGKSIEEKTKRLNPMISYIIVLNKILGKSNEKDLKN